MYLDKIEEAFYLYLEGVQLLQGALKTSFLDAYIENIENINDEYQVRVLDGVPDQATVAKLQTTYQKIKAIELLPEEKRKLSQLLLLKGMQTEPLQANHQLTPDSIGFLFVFLLEQLYPDKTKSYHLLDLTVGMGNLLLTLLTNLKQSGYQIEATGVDNDETLLAIASSNSQWIGEAVSLFHQDSLQDLLVDPVDMAVGDLPIGYYPIDENAQRFTTGVKNGHSYAHHLLLEQSMHYVKEEGFGLFLLPSNFLETEQSGQFKAWLAEKEAFLQGVIQLPDELFKSKAAQKSILLLQRAGKSVKQVPEVLVAKLETLKDPKAVVAFFDEFKAWQQANLQ